MLILDKHEPNSLEIQFKKLGIQVERQVLKSGDIAFADIGIERKTMNDFLSTIYQRRLFDQMYRLKNSFDRPILFIIGDIPDERWMRLGRRLLPIKLSQEDKDKKNVVVLHTINTVFNSYKVPTFRVTYERDYIIQVSDLYFKTMGTETKLKPVAPKSHTVQEVKSDIIACVPLFGRKHADILANKYSIKELANMSEQDLIGKIEGLGEKRAKALNEVLTK